MNNEIQSLEFEGNKVRTAQDENGNPLFCGTDVAQVLGYANPAKAVINHCKGFPIWKPLETAGGIQQVRFISEGDLYRLITSSKLPAAERFEKWVYDEVLPQIRKTGGYIPTSDADDDMTILAKAVMIGQRTMEEQKQRIAAQQSRIDELQPKASAWDNFVDIPDALSVRDSAKLLSDLGRPVGQTKLFEWLDRHDWIFRENKHWSARQSRINAGHLMMVPSKSHGTHKDGTPFAFPPTVKVTRKGLALIARRFGEETLQLEYPKAGA